MARYTIGKIALSPKGEYNSQTNYTKLDLVEYEGSGYVNISPCVGVLPTDTTKWMLLVEKGSWSTFTEEEKEAVITQITPLIEEEVDDKTLDIQLAFDYTLEVEDSTPSGGEWILPQITLAAGDEIVIKWETPLNNHIFFATSDSQYREIYVIEDINPTETTSGVIKYTAPTSSQTMRIFSEYNVLSVKIYKESDTNVFNDIYDTIDELERETNEDKAELQEEILEINNELYGTLIKNSTTSQSQQWVLASLTLRPNETALFTWETPLHNLFSIEAGNSNFEKTFDIYSEANTTETKGVYRYTASSTSYSIRVFSELPNFTINIYKISDTSKIDDLVNEIGINIVSFQTNTDGLISSVDGTKDTSLSWYGDNCSFEVKGGQVVNFYQAPLANGYGHAFYNNNTFISGEHFDLNQVELKSVVVPSDANRMAISWNRNHIPTQEVTIDNSIDSLRTRLSDVENKTEELEHYLPYKGKKILSIGDSYAMMNYYGKYLAEVTGCEQTPRGYNGQNIRHFAEDTYQSSDDWAVNITLPLTPEYLKGFDIITIMGGTNDYGQNCAAGTLADDKDTNSVVGHVKWLVDRLYTLNPDAKIIFCTQPYRVPHPAFHDGLGGHLPNSSGSTLEDCMNAVVETCRYYSIPCFDFYHLSGWNEWTNRITNPENGQPSSSNIYPPFNDNKKTMDGLHPRDGEGNGAQQLGYQFGKYINLN